MELQCLKCKYQYDSDKLPKLCPFCGTSGTVQRVPSAGALLTEASEDEERLKEAEKRKEEWKKRLQN